MQFLAMQSYFISNANIALQANPELVTWHKVAATTFPCSEFPNQELVEKIWLAEELEEKNLLSEDIGKVVKRQVKLMGLTEEVRELRATINQRPEGWTAGSKVWCSSIQSHANYLIVTGLDTNHCSYARTAGDDRQGEDAPWTLKSNMLFSSWAVRTFT